ncbi:Electron transport complex protein RnfG [hydrothermal vent metagenome]|uniref:Electron transport complex protein RnfG n=1 Tax=hydrothermal vent metagenome TaxID=652676 RepID=A0A3B0UXD7_9ZZZZ
MKNASVKMIITLTITSIIIGALLAGFFKFVSPSIEANRLAEEKKAIFAVLPGAQGYDIKEFEIPSKRKGKEMLRIFRGKDKNGNVIGYAFIAAGAGFQGIIKMMVGLNLEKVDLTGMTILDQKETPGLGAKIRDVSFQAQFKGLRVKPRIEYLKNKKPEKPNQIQAITGATISSRAVVRTLNKQIKLVLSLLSSGSGMPQAGGGPAEPGGK